MNVQSRKFTAAAAAAAAMPLLPACSGGCDDQRTAGVPVGPFGLSSTAEEVTARLNLSGKTAPYALIAARRSRASAQQAA